MARSVHKPPARACDSFFSVEQRGRLSKAFRAAALDAGSTPDEATLAAACVHGRAAHPGITVDDQVFVRHLAAVVARRPEDGSSLDGLALDDLYLASACLAGAPGAVAALRALHGATMRAAIARIVSAADVAEVEQQVLDALVVGLPGVPGKIASYGGQAPLERWLRVTAQRTALMAVRSARTEGRARRAAAAESPRSIDAPEIAYLKERYRTDFEQALEQALARLNERDRALLRLHLVGGLTVQGIGKAFGVSQPTASRWLAQARAALLDDIKATLRARLGTSSAELASIAGLVASRLDLSLSQLLRTR
jgi:RNA polymerase sigma-70 factor (ECF subfamily)